MRLTQYFEHGYDPKTLTVRQVMEGAVFTVSPDTKGITIAEAMTKRNFGTVPVVEQDSTLVGLCPNSTCYGQSTKREISAISRLKA